MHLSSNYALEFFLICIIVFQIFNSLHLSKIEKILTQLTNEERGLQKDMALDFTAINAAIAAESDVANKAVILLGELVTEIATIAGGVSDPADQLQLNALATNLQQETAGLTAAIAAVPASDIPAQSTVGNVGTTNIGTVSAIVTGGTSTDASVNPPQQ